MIGNIPNLIDGILFTDFYQLTMAQLYFRTGLHRARVRFEYLFRTNPDYGGHQAGYCVFAGLETLVAWVKSARFDPPAIERLREHRGRSGKRTFSDDFLEWAAHLDLAGCLSIRSVPEGRVVHPGEPLVSVEGELAAAQIVESSLLNHLNFQTLIATKAARIREAGGGRPLIEFGLRRAHDRGANAATRAALIGGADFSSNTGMSYALGFPPKGTHAHSMVQMLMAIGEGELGAFRAYAELYPDDCLLLVDTVDTLRSGVPNAIVVFEELRRKGHRPAGIRLDSGDLAYLSIQSSLMLDKAGFPDTDIVLSNSIDEMVLLQVLRQIRDEAPAYGVDPERLIARLVYGVGTRLVTSEGRGSLDGVYKLTAVQRGSTWVPAYKISDSPAKTITPGSKRLWRVYGSDSRAVADLVGLASDTVATGAPLELYHPALPGIMRALPPDRISAIEELHVDVLRDGRLVYDFQPIQELRRRRDRDLSLLDPGVKRLVNPHIYHVSLTRGLLTLKEELIASRRQQ